MSRFPSGKPTYRAARRIAIAVVGATLLLVGVILVFTPGPAIVVFTLALSVLAVEFAWARRWLRRLKETAKNSLDGLRGRTPKDAQADGDGPDEATRSVDSPREVAARTTRPDPSGQGSGSVDASNPRSHETRRERSTPMARLPEPEDHRTPDHDILPIFPRRWSPRAMSGEPLEDEVVRRLFEAARWAPSTFNEQEWRFVYARAHGAHWDTFFGLLADANKAWCHRAGLIGCVLSHKVFARNGNPNPVNVFDSGLAYMSLALQGSEMGLVVHGLLGFDSARARSELDVPDDYNVNAMFVVGHPGDPAALPDGYREREKPSDRKTIGEIAREGLFDF